MDGKKRISRLRNVEKWKKIGLGCFGQFLEQHRKAKAKSIAKDAAKLLMVGLEPVNVGVKGKKRDKGAPRTDGKIWDAWSYTWKFPVKPGPFGCAQKMIAALEKKGYKKLGSGHYSTVLAKPGSDRVIKVTRHQDNWIDYVKWAAENGYAGGFAPRVYSWKKFPGDWSWAVMERMERTIGGSYDDFSYPGAKPRERKEDDFALVFSLLAHAGHGNLLAQVYMEDLAPGAFAFVKALRETMRASDIRGPNTMLRKDGSLCFTDPCAGETKITKTRLRSGDFSPSVWRYLIEGCYRHRSQQA